MFLTEEQLYSLGLEDFDALIETYGEGEYNDKGEFGWWIEDYSEVDQNENGVFDFIDALNGNPVSQHISQGGAFG